MSDNQDSVTVKDGWSYKLTHTQIGENNRLAFVQLAMKVVWESLTPTDGLVVRKGMFSLDKLLEDAGFVTNRPYLSKLLQSHGLLANLGRFGGVPGGLTCWQVADPCVVDYVVTLESLRAFDRSYARKELRQREQRDQMDDLNKRLNELQSTIAELEAKPPKSDTSSNETGVTPEQLAEITAGILQKEEQIKSLMLTVDDLTSKLANAKCPPSAAEVAQQLIAEALAKLKSA